MRNKKGLSSGGIITIVALLFLGIIAGVLIYNNQSKPLSVGVLSMSNIQVKDNGAKILVTVTPQGPDDLEIYFTPEELNNALESQGYRATQASILKVKYVESSKKFYFTDNDQSSIKAIKVTDTGNYWGLGTSKSAIVSYCINKGYPNTVSAYYTDTGLQISNVNCVEYFNNGYVNAFNTGLGTDGFKVEFNLNGEVAYITGDEQFVSMANGKALISWQGSLLGINNIGAPNYDVYHIENQWYLVDKNAYASVSSAFSNFISCMDSTNWLGTRPNVNDFNSCKNNYMNIYNANIQSKNAEYISQVSNAESISFSQGIMFVNLKQPTFKPVFTIELDATKVGLIRLAGEPQITNCITNQYFTSAGTKSTSATIQNMGSNEGYFDFKITCDNEEMSGHADSLNFNAGETKTVNFQIYGGNTGTSTNSGRCEIKVTDRASQKSDSCFYDMDVAYKSGISECVGTETRCSGDLKSVYNCVNNKWVRSECIGDLSCGYRENIAQCLSGEGETLYKKCSSCEAFAKSKLFGFITTDEESELKCTPKLLQNFTFCWASFLRLLMIPVALILTMLFSGELLNSFKSIKKNKIAKFLISLILGVIVAYIFYVVFWLAIVMIIILLIVGRFLPKR